MARNAPPPMMPSDNDGDEAPMAAPGGPPPMAAPAVPPEEAPAEAAPPPHLVGGAHEGPSQRLGGHAAVRHGGRHPGHAPHRGQDTHHGLHRFARGGEG